MAALDYESATEFKRAWFIRLFSDLPPQPCQLELAEHHNPGATAALRSWAAIHNHALTERSLAPPGVPSVITLDCQVRLATGDGPRIVVTRYGAAS